MKRNMLTIGAAAVMAVGIFAMSANVMAEDSHYPVTITTYNHDREPIEVTFDKAPERVAAYANSNIEEMLALGLEDKIVMAWGLDGDVSEEYQEAFAGLNFLEEWPTQEEVIAAEPDFICAWYSSFADDRLGSTEFWIERGCNTYMSMNSSAMGPATEVPREIKWEMQDILNLGIIFDCEEKAQEIVDQMQNEIDKVKAYVEGKESLSVAVLEDESDSFRVYGANVLGGDIPLAIGATLAVGAEDSENISAEDLIAANPDVIFMVYYDGFMDEVSAVTDITENPAFASLSAVQNEKVYSINLNEIYCSGIHTYDGIVHFAKALYPELYQE